MQFFTPFGLWSYIGVLISGFILGFIGRQVAKELVQPSELQS